MENYKFKFEDKTYELNQDNCNYFLNCEEFAVEEFDEQQTLKLLNQFGEADFTIEYYDQPCVSCKHGIKDKEKYFKFLEYHFYIFTKNSKYVISNISKEYQGLSFNKLLKKGLVDNSFLISVMVCMNCGDYSIEIDQCEV